jgi:hypothetical protein
MEMTEFDTACFEQLKNILKSVRSPENLNDHPWTHSLIVQEELACNPQLREASPGQQLVSAIIVPTRPSAASVLTHAGENSDSSPRSISLRLTTGNPIQPP